MKNIRIQWFVLFITVLLLMGCGMQKNIDLKSDQGMKIANALPIREDTGLVKQQSGYTGRDIGSVPDGL